MRPLENRVVVELGVLGQAVPPPMVDQRRNRLFRSPRRLNPTAAHASVDGHSIQDHDVGPTTDDQTLYEVETLQLGLSSRNLRQIPTRWRRRTTDTLATIEQTAANQDPTDSPHGWQRLDTSPLEFVVDRPRSEFSKSTRLPKFSTQEDHHVLGPSRGRLLLTPPTARTTRPINTIQALLACTVHPDLDRPETDLKPLCHRTQRGTVPNSRNDQSSFTLLGVLVFVFWLMETFQVRGFSLP
jgi:hypothetical protein